MARMTGIPQLLKKQNPEIDRKITGAVLYGLYLFFIDL